MPRRARIALLALLVALVTVGCEKETAPATPATAQNANVEAKEQAEAAPAIPDDQSGEGSSEDGHFWITYAPTPNPIPFQDHFTLDVAVYDPSDHARLLTDVTIDEVRADMPAHNHGMKVKPIVEKKEDGTFRVEGMRFHMGGEGKHGRWVIGIVASQGGVVDQGNFPVQCCKALEGVVPSHPLP